MTTASTMTAHEMPISGLLKSIVTNKVDPPPKIIVMIARDVPSDIKHLISIRPYINNQKLHSLE